MDGKGSGPLAGGKGPDGLCDRGSMCPRRGPTIGTGMRRPRYFSISPQASGRSRSLPVFAHQVAALYQHRLARAIRDKRAPLADGNRHIVDDDGKAAGGAGGTAGTGTVRPVAVRFREFPSESRGQHSANSQPVSLSCSAKSI